MQFRKAQERSDSGIGMPSRTSELWIGSDFVRGDIHTYMGAPHVRLVLCPLCLKGTALQRFRDTQPYSFDPEDILPNYSAFQDAESHMRSCRPIFRDNGIVPIRNQAQAEAVEEMAKWSKLDAGWDTRQCTADLLSRQSDTFAALAKVEDGRVKGYACFKRVRLREGETSVLWDLYVFTPFRGRGIGRELVSAGIETFQISAARLPVSAPVRPAAARIVHRLATDIVLEVWPNRYEAVSRDEFLRRYADASVQ